MNHDQEFARMFDVQENDKGDLVCLSCGVVHQICTGSRDGGMSEVATICNALTWKIENWRPSTKNSGVYDEAIRNLIVVTIAEGDRFIEIHSRGTIADFSEAVSA